MSTATGDKTLPKGIFKVTSRNVYKVQLQRQNRTYRYGEFRTLAEALAALDELLVILKDTPPAKGGGWHHAGKRKRAAKQPRWNTTVDNTTISYC